MQQILTTWATLDIRRRIIVVGVTILVFISVLALSVLNARPNFALLYAGLDPAQAGEVIAALERQGTPYEARGDSLYVDAASRDELRMMLAAEGLPKANGNGYELLDTLSGFGTTSQMFDAAYWRAKEGELARTILANPAVRLARVHIAATAAPALRATHRPTASVTVTTVLGGLPVAQAKALQFLVSSAVAGMRPEDVSVIDSTSGLVSAGEVTGAQAESDRAVVLRRNIERLLEARVGYGNAVVEVAVETVTEREAITERRFDPQGRVVISSETTETSKQADQTKAAAVTVASNLPEGDGASEGKSQSQATETRERTNFEVSETTRELLRSPGDIKRLSVAVLVDGVEGVDANGQTQVVPRDQAELASLRDLVASVIGYQEARGDQITIRSLPFQPHTARDGTEAAAAGVGGLQLDLMKLIQTGVLALVALVLGLFVVRPLLLGRVKTPEPVGLPAPSPGAQSMPVEQMPDFSSPGFPAIAAYDAQDIHPPVPDGATAMDRDPVERLKRLIEARRNESVEILRDWMENTEGRA